MKMKVCLAAVAVLSGLTTFGSMGGLRAVQLDLARQKETVPFVKAYLARVRQAGFNTVVLYLEDRIRTAAVLDARRAEKVSSVEILIGE